MKLFDLLLVGVYFLLFFFFFNTEVVDGAVVGVRIFTPRGSWAGTGSSRVSGMSSFSRSSSTRDEFPYIPGSGSGGSSVNGGRKHDTILQADGSALTRRKAKTASYSHGFRGTKLN